MLRNRFKIGFWNWQFIIAMSFLLFALYIVLFIKIDYNYSSYISICGARLQIDDRFFEWGFLPALSVVAINVAYRFFYMRIRYGSKCNYSSTKSVLVHGLKYIGIFVAIIIIAVEWFLFGIIGHPLHMLITIMAVSMVLFSLLKGEHWIFWICTILLFTIIGIYFIFNNDLPGETSWRIADRPIDVPRQWLYNYRFFWWGVIINETFQYAGLISFILLALLKFTRFRIISEMKK